MNILRFVVQELSLAFSPFFGLLFINAAGEAQPQALLAFTFGISLFHFIVELLIITTLRALKENLITRWEADEDESDHLTTPLHTG